MKRQQPFTYHRLKYIAEGAYGTVYLTKIPERELQPMKNKRKRLPKKEIQIIKKEFTKRSAISTEIYYFKKISDNIKQYFPLFYRAYERIVDVKSINFFGEKNNNIFHNNDVIYGIDMEYLHPSRWQLLETLFQKDDKRIDNIFRQLIHFQIALFKEGGMYYDVSPYNIFVCRTTNKIRMVDYGGLFVPEDPQMLYQGQFEDRTFKQKFPNPFHKHLKVLTTTQYKNIFFEGPLKKTVVIPALYAIIITVHMCLTAMIHPRQDLSYFEDALKSQNIFINTLLNNPDIINDWTLLDEDGGGKGDGKTHTLST